MFSKFLLSPLSGYLAVAMATVVLGLTTALWWQDRKLTKVNRGLAVSQANTQTALTVNATIRETLDSCQETNAFNAAQRELAAERADAAVNRADLFEAHVTELLAKQYEPDTECRTLTERLPTDYIDWVCIPGANCISTDGIR